MRAAPGQVAKRAEKHQRVDINIKAGQIGIRGRPGPRGYEGPKGTLAGQSTPTVGGSRCSDHTALKFAESCY